METAMREATEADIPAILSLYAQLGQDDGTVLEPEDARRIWTRMATYPDYRIYVAIRETDVVGAFALLIMDNLAHRGTPSAVIEDVVVKQEMRGQGIGRRMMMFARKLCREKGCYKMAFSSNRNRTQAHRFYESSGFNIHGYSFSIETEAETR